MDFVFCWCRLFFTHDGYVLFISKGCYTCVTTRGTLHRCSIVCDNFYIAPWQNKFKNNSFLLTFIKQCNCFGVKWTRVIITASVHIVHTLFHIDVYSHLQKYKLYRAMFGLMTIEESLFNIIVLYFRAAIRNFPN